MKHNYENIIEEWLYNKCQEVRSKHSNEPFKFDKTEHLFAGLTHCAECGCAYSTDFQRKKNIKYLFCTKYHRECNNARVKESDVINQVSTAFKTIKIPEKAIEQMIVKLKEETQAEREYRDILMKNAKDEYELISKKLDTLLDIRLSDPNGQSITHDEYTKKVQELRQRQEELSKMLSGYSKEDEKFSIIVSYILNLVSRASEIFESSKVEEKRMLMGFVLSNLEIKDKKLVYEWKKPYDVIAKYASRSQWSGREDLNLRPLAPKASILAN